MLALLPFSAPSLASRSPRSPNEKDGSVTEVLANEVRLGLPGEDGGPVNGSFLLVVEATGPNEPRKAAPRTEICTIRVIFWGTFEGVVEEGERPLEPSGSAIYNGRFENVNCVLGFNFDLTGEYLGYEVGWHAEWTDFGYMGALESDEDGDDLTFVTDELLEP